MGGLGSTRWNGYQAKNLVEETPRLCVPLGLPRLDPRPGVDLAAVDRDGEELHHQRFSIARPALSRGGYAVRVVCTCGRRCRFLYFVGGVICCQKCGGLVHRSTRESHDWGFERLFRQICREKSITGLTYGQFMKHFRRR